jgi:hypothetical protein
MMDDAASTRVPARATSIHPDRFFGKPAREQHAAAEDADRESDGATDQIRKPLTHRG